MRTLVSWIAVLVLVLTPAGALQSDEEVPKTKEEKIRALLEQPAILPDLFGGMEEALQDLHGVGVGLAEKIREMADEEELLDVLVPIFAEHLDEEALDALLAFQATPEGKRLVVAFAKIREAAEPAVKAWAKALVEKAGEALRSEIAEESLPRPGVKLSAGSLKIDWFAEWDRFGVVTDIRRGDLDSTPGLEIGIVGTRATLITDDETREKVLSAVEFEPAVRDPGLVDADADGRVEFYERSRGRGMWGAMEREKADRRWGALDLLDAEGKLRWSYATEEEALCMAAGDLDDDPEAEFAVGFTGGEGLHLVDHEGEVVWKVAEDEVPRVEIADLDGDGTAEIVHTDADGRIKVRGTDGSVVRRLTLAEPVGGFSLCRFPHAPDATHLLVWSARKGVRILDGYGKKVYAFDLPEGPPVKGAWGTPVRFVADRDPFFALIVHYEGPNRVQALAHRGARGALLVYGPDGALFRHDVLEAMGSGLAAIPEDDEGAEALLVADDRKVTEYVWDREGERRRAELEEAAQAARFGLPDAPRAMRELLPVVADLEARILRLDVKPSGARLRVEVEAQVVFDEVRKRLERSEYLRERARDPKRLVEVGAIVAKDGRWYADFALRFRLDWTGDGAPKPSHGISLEVMQEAAIRAGLLQVYASREIATPSRSLGVERIAQRFEYQAADGKSESLTLARLEALLEAVSSNSHYRVTEVTWSRAGEGDVIGRPRIEVATWQRIRR